MPSLAQKVLLDLLGGLSRATITYQLRDDFSQEISPVTNPKSATDGSEWVVMDAEGNKLTETGGRFQYLSQVSGAWGDLGMYHNSVTLPVILRWSNTISGHNGQILGLGIGENFAHTSMQVAWSTNGPNYQRVWRGGATIAQFAGSWNGTYAILYDGANAYWFFDDKLFWVDSISVSDLRPKLTTYEGSGSLDFVYATSAPFTPAAMLSQTNPSTGVEYTGASEGVIDVNIVLPTADLTPLMRVGVKYCMNGDDYWFVWFQRNAANTNWDFQAGVVSGGGNPSFSVNTASVGTGHTKIRIVKRGNTHWWITYAGSTLTQRGNATSTTHTNNSGVGGEYRGEIGNTLILNGNFSTGDLTNWSQLNGSSWAVVSNEAVLTADNSSTLIQYFDVEEGETYAIKFSARVDASTLRVRSIAGSLIDESFSSSIDYVGWHVAPITVLNRITFLRNLPGSVDLGVDDVVILLVGALDNGSDGPTQLTVWDANDSQYSQLAQVGP